jgi:Flp pilus assembly protein TadG
VKHLPVADVPDPGERPLAPMARHLTPAARRLARPTRHPIPAARRLTPAARRLTRSAERRDDRGAVAVLTAILLTMLLGFAALVIDIGLARDQGRQAQAAVDSAALAAAIVMKANNGAESAQAAARNAATSYLLANYDSPAGPAEFSTAWNACSTCVSFTDTRVTVSLEPLPADKVDTPAVLGGIFGLDRLSASAAATAEWAHVPAFPCWLCVQSQTSSLGVDAQDGSVAVDTGNIRVGTVAPATLSVTSGSVTASSGEIGYVNDSGNTNTPTRTTGSYSPTPVAVTATSPTTTALPPVTGPVLDAPTTTNGVCSPGIYRDITGCYNGFLSGLYVITEPNVFTGGGSVSTQPGVSFYLTCSENGQVTPCAQATDKSGGTLTWSRDGDFHVYGPASGWSSTIAVDPGNQADQDFIDITQTTLEHATARLYVTGALYAPGSQVTVRTESWWDWHHLTLGLLDVTGQVTVDRLHLSGTAAQLLLHGTPPASAPAPVAVHLR